MTERRSPFSERWVEREAFAEMSAELSAERHFLLSAELSAVLSLSCIKYEFLKLFMSFLVIWNCQKFHFSSMLLKIIKFNVEVNSNIENDV